jgi:hypothetical protein
VAFARRDEAKPKIVTVIPGGDIAMIERALDEEMSGNNLKNRLNRLGSIVRSVDPKNLVKAV